MSHCHTVAQGSQYHYDGEHVNPAGQRAIIRLVNEYVEFMQAISCFATIYCCCMFLESMQHSTIVRHLIL